MNENKEILAEMKDELKVDAINKEATKKLASAEMEHMREEFKERMKTLKVQAEREKEVLQEQYNSIKSRIFTDNLAKKSTGEVEKCRNAIKDTESQNAYCTIKFSLFPDEISKCSKMEKDMFCPYCCFAEFEKGEKGVQCKSEICSKQEPVSHLTFSTSQIWLGSK